MKRARLFFIVATFTAASVLLEVFSGFVLWLILPYSAGRDTVFIIGRNVWSAMHLWDAVAATGILLLHIALHWGWIWRQTRSFFTFRDASVPQPIRKPSFEMRPAAAAYALTDLLKSDEEVNGVDETQVQDPNVLPTAGVAIGELDDVCFGEESGGGLPMTGSAMSAVVAEANEGNSSGVSVHDGSLSVTGHLQQLQGSLRRAFSGLKAIASREGVAKRTAMVMVAAVAVSTVIGLSIHASARHNQEVSNS